MLEELRPITGLGRWVFASPRKPDAPIVQIRRFAKKAARESGVIFVARDLRRTISTGLTRLGVQQLTVSKLLNHTIQGVTDRHYDRHTYDPEKRHAVQVWDAHLAGLIDRPQEESTSAATSG